MTLNGVMAVTLRYFTELGKPALRKTICGEIYASVYCIFSACTMSSQRKFTFAMSSPDEFLVICLLAVSHKSYQSCLHDNFYLPTIYLWTRKIPINFGSYPLPDDENPKTETFTLVQCILLLLQMATPLAAMVCGILELFIADDVTFTLTINK